MPSELQQAAPAGQGRQPQAQEGSKEPGPQALQGPGHGPGLAAAHAQRQHQQDAGGQPQEQGATTGPGSAGRWGPRGQVSLAGRPDSPAPAGTPRVPSSLRGLVGTLQGSPRGWHLSDPQGSRGAWVSLSLSGQWAPCNGGLLRAPCPAPSHGGQ